MRPAVWEEIGTGTRHLGAHMVAASAEHIAAHTAAAWVDCTGEAEVVGQIAVGALPEHLAEVNEGDLRTSKLRRPDIVPLRRRFHGHNLDISWLTFSNI